MTPTKEELLQGLTYVQGMLAKMQEVLSRYIAQERNFRKTTKEIDTKATIKSDLRKIFAISALAVSLLLVLVSPLRGEFLVFAIMVVILMAVAFVSKKIVMAGAKVFGTEAGAFTLMAIRKGTRRDIGLFSGILILAHYICKFFAYLLTIAIVLEAGVLGILMLAAVIAVEVYFINEKNKKIAAGNQNVAANNEEVRAKRKALYDQYLALQNELQRRAPSWFPPDYYNMEAVNFFIHAIRNGRADSVKEMVNLFESTSQHKEMVAYQKQQTQQLNQLVAGQQAIQGQLRFANMMNVVNFIKLDNIADAVGY